MVAGSVRTQAAAIRHTVGMCTPAPDPTIVPAIPEVTTCVVETGPPVNAAMPITVAEPNPADAPGAGGSRCLPSRSPSVLTMRLYPTIVPNPRQIAERILTHHGA